MKYSKHISQEEILRLTRHYTSTGRIDGALTPYFDQRGRWLGDKRSWKDAVWFEARSRMAGALLEPGRRAYRSGSASILRTSFHWRDPGPVVLTYDRICGNFTVASNSTIHAAKLKQVDGTFHSRTRKWLYLPKLTTVGADFTVRKSFLLRAPQLSHVGGHVMVLGQSLPHLETVGGDYRVRWLLDFNSPRLTYVGGSLNTHHADEVHLPALRAVLRDFIATNPVRLIDAPLLEAVGRNFLAGSAVKINTPSLHTVSGNLDSRNARNYFSPNIHVGGTWTTYPDDEIHYKARMLLRHSGSGPICL